jgi:hypothetical protein
MRYLLMFKPDANPDPAEHACKQDVPEMATLIADLTRAGVVVSTVGLKPGDSGARLRMSGGKFTMTDGPFAEAKELVAGVCLVEVPSKDEATKLARRFLEVAGGGEAEVREVQEPGHPTTTS